MMKIFLKTLFLFLVLLASEKTVQASPSNLIGKTEAQVLNELGKPIGIMDFGDRRVLLFDDATVTVRRQRVVEVEVHPRGPLKEKAYPQESEVSVEETPDIVITSDARMENSVVNDSPESVTEKPLPWGAQILGSIFQGQLQANRAKVVQENIENIQQGRVIVLPDVDPQTLTIKGYKAVDRQIYEKVGGVAASRMSREELSNLQKELQTKLAQ